jgi:Domain of unknown function (DUF222)
MATADMSPGPVFGSTGEAVQVMQDAARYLAGVSYPDLPAQVIGDVLAGMERIDAAQAAIRGRAGDAFIDAKAHLEWGQKNLGAWYRNETKVTGPAAKANRGWVKQLLEHPLIISALAEQHVISASWAQQVAGWTIQLPEQYVQQADEILMEAARNGVNLAGLARIAAELGALLADPSKDEGKEPGPGLRLELTFEGAGVLHGDLTPACAAKVKAVLEALADAMTTPGDDRSRHEKLHDALEEAMTRLLAARLVPQSQGAPTTAIAHIHFGDLVEMDQDSVLLDRWKQDIAAQWAAEQAGASTQPGDGGCWLTGDEARRVACDAMIVPIVTATLDTTHLSDLILACIAYHQAAQTQAQAQAAQAQSQAAQDGQAQDGQAQDGQPVPVPVPDLDDLTRRILGIVIAIASGTASYLRRNQLSRIGLGGPSLPLDVGKSSRIPPQIRRAVTLRDKGTCAFPGGCGQPAQWCDQHHTIHQADGGETAVRLIGLFCQHHHDFLIHGLGWTITIEPDGTMTARKPDGSLYKRSHPPPPRPG